VIGLANGRTVTAWAVQEANLSDWLGRKTRSKRIAAELMDIAAQAEEDPA
jgi:hypothetical protein